MLRVGEEVARSIPGCIRGQIEQFEARHERRRQALEGIRISSRFWTKRRIGARDGIVVVKWQCRIGFRGESNGR